MNHTQTKTKIHVDDLGVLARMAATEPALAVDTESSGLKRDSFLRMIQIGTAHDVVVLQGCHVDKVAEVMANFKGELRCHHQRHEFKFLPWMRELRLFDVQEAAILVEPYAPRGLQDSAGRHVDPEPNRLANRLKEIFDSMVTEDGKKISWHNIPFDTPEYIQYGAMDVVHTFLLADVYKKKIDSLCLARAWELELQMQPLCDDLEMRGVQVDLELCEQRLSVIKSKEDEIAAYLHGLGLKSFGGKNLALFIHEMTGSEKVFNDSKSGYSTSEATLTEIGGKYCELVLEKRALNKLGSTYYKNWLDSADDSGRIHPYYKSQGAVQTGRMASNLQQVPKIPDGPRDAIIARPGSRLVNADFDQIEPRLLARFSQDPALAAAFEAEDFYSAVNLDLDRSHKKVVVLSHFYGSGVGTHMQRTGLSKKKITEAITQLDEEFPRAAQFRDKKIQGSFVSREYGRGAMVKTALGRRLYFSRREAYTKAVNYTMQGTAAEVMKLSALKVAEALPGQIIAIVHDEIMIESTNPKRDATVVEECMRDTRSKPWLVATAKIGDNYGQFS